jgi:hypothetical protein
MELPDSEWTESCLRKPSDPMQRSSSAPCWVAHNHEDAAVRGCERGRTMLGLCRYWLAPLPKPYREAWRTTLLLTQCVSEIRSKRNGGGFEGGLQCNKRRAL